MSEPALARAVEYTGVTELRGPLLVVRDVRGRRLGRVRRGSGSTSGRDPARAGARGRPRPGRRPGARGHRRACGRTAPGSPSPGSRCTSRSATGWLGPGLQRPRRARSTAGRRCSAAAERAGGRARRSTRRAGSRRPSRCSPASPRSTRSPRWSAARSCRSSRSPGCRTSSSPPRSPRRPPPATSRSASSSPGMGLTHADAAAVRDALEERSAAGELVLLLNTADDPVIERILTPRIALTVAEHLAFDRRPARAGGDGRHDQLRRGAARGVRGPRRDPGPAGLPGLPLQRPRLAVRTLRADPRAARVGHRAAGADDAGRRHHPPGARPDRLHHRGPGRALRRGARARGVYPPVDPLSLAVAADAARRRARAGPARTTSTWPRRCWPRWPGPGRCASSPSWSARTRSATPTGATCAFADAVERAAARPAAATSRAPSTTPWTGPGRRCAVLPRRELTMLSAAPLDAHLAAARHRTGEPVPRLRRVPPGRAGRLWLQHRLAVAERGADAAGPEAADPAGRGAPRPRSRPRTPRRRGRPRAEEAERWLVRAVAARRGTGGPAGLGPASRRRSRSPGPRRWACGIPAARPACPPRPRTCRWRGRRAGAGPGGPPAGGRRGGAARGRRGRRTPAPGRGGRAPAGGSARSRTAGCRCWRARCAATELGLEEQEHADGVRLRWARSVAEQPFTGDL